MTLKPDTFPIEEHSWEYISKPEGFIYDEDEAMARQKVQSFANNSQAETEAHSLKPDDLSILDALFGDENM